MTEMSALTTTNMLAAVSGILTEGGYRQIEDEIPKFWASESTRLFEDQYGIVAVVVYETWKNLASNWIEAQGNLVELISGHVLRTDAKAWEGYLVLLTPSSAGSHAEVANIRYDTTRVRKIVSTGEELNQLRDLKVSLLPLLPFGEEGQVEKDQSVLDMLPDLLVEKGLERKTVQSVIDAYYEQRSLMEHLDKYGREQ